LWRRSGSSEAARKAALRVTCKRGRPGFPPGACCREPARKAALRVTWKTGSREAARKAASRVTLQER
jgi:hypothetical protein